MCRRGLKVNGVKSKVMLLNGKEGDGICLEHVSNLNIWDVFWMNQVQIEHSVVGSW